MFKDSPVFSGFSVKDKVEAWKFYEEILGCDIADNGMGLVMKFPGGQTVFLYEKEDHEPASYTVLNFPVDNINAAVDELIAKGITMERYEGMPGNQDERGVLRGKAAGMGPDIAWFKDPSRNILAVLED